MDKSQSKTAAAFYKEGNELFEKERYKEAIRCYDKAIALEPSNYEYIHQRALCHGCMGLYKEVRNDMLRVLVLKPDFAEGWLVLGIAKENLQDRDGAIEAFEEALKVSPDFRDAEIRLELIKSRQSLGSSSKTDSPDYSAILEQALSLEREDRYNEALALVEETLRKDSNDFRLLLSKRVIMAKIEAAQQPEPIIGLEEPQEEINMFITKPLTDPNPLYKTKLAKASKGAILYGPPGTGKNHLIFNLAKAAGIKIIAIMLYEIIDKWAGESEKHLKTLFYDAKDKAEKELIMIFVNEMDALGSARRATSESEEGSWSRDLRNTFRMLLDEVQNVPNLVVVGATNYIWSVDSALKRGSGRFGGCIIYIGPPDERTREQLFKHYSEEIPRRRSVDFKKLARMTQWFTGADIHEICRKVLFKVAAENKPKAVAKTEYYEQFIKKTFPVALTWLREVAEEWVNGRIKDDIDERLLDDICMVDPLAKMKREELKRARERTRKISTASEYVS